MRGTRFRALLEAEVTPVYRFALRLTGDIHVAEDLTQDAMLRAWKARRKAPEGEIRPWLLRIARNLWIDESRRRGVRTRHTRVVSDGRIAPDGRAADGAVDRAGPEEPEVIRLLDRLPPRQREVLYLSACEGLTPTQIGRVLGITPEAAKASASIARARLRQLRGVAEGVPNG